MRLRAIQFAPRRALRAARILAADPDALAEVFTIIESLSIDTVARVHRRMKASAAGQRLLSERPEVVACLSDRAALARLPEGSLGRAYLAFVERENISAEGIIAANAQGGPSTDFLPPPIDYVHARLRDTHDLWHAAVGLHGDVLGETVLLAFSFAQIWNPAIALIIGIGLVKTAHRPGAARLILEGFRRGWNAAWLPEQPWETMLALPLDEVRARLKLETPIDYQPLRSVELKPKRAA